MMLIPKINELVKKREDAGLTRRELALRAGLGNSAISRIESGAVKRVQMLRAREIAKILNCKTEELFLEETK